MRRERFAVAGFGLLLAAGALFMTATALHIPVRAADMLWGPRLFPVAVMTALAIVCVSIAAFELFSPAVDDRATSTEPNDWSAIVSVLAGLALFAALVEFAGFVIAAAALFVLVSRGFGSKRLPLDASIGLILAAAIFVLFVRGLGLFLPAGTLFSGLLGR
jgi:putative tricarboxylic transport membrane protein